MLTSIQMVVFRLNLGDGKSVVCLLGKEDGERPLREP